MTLDDNGFPVVSYQVGNSFGLKIAHCNDANCAGGNESIQTIEPPPSGSANSLQLDSNGFPVIAYDRPNISLKVAHCNDADCAGSNESLQTVDNGPNFSRDISLLLDNDGFPVISYDGCFGSTSQCATTGLVVAHCNDANCAGDDESIEFIALENANWNSLALDNNGFPVIGYPGPFDVKIIHCNDANCAGGDESIEVVSSVDDRASFPSLVLDSNGFPVMSYQAYAPTGGHLKVVHCNDANCAGGDESIQTVDSVGTVGGGSSLKLDSNGFPVISYTLFASGPSSALKVLHCNDVNCAGGDESIQAFDTNSVVDHWTSLALDSNGFPVVSYSTREGLRVLHCDDPNCAPPPPQTCGNNIVEGSEQCDDGNTADGDCCSSSCQFEPNGIVCRAPTGACDVAETCTGSSGTCPGETFESPSTVCRAAVGECDLAENCSGTSADCPSDGVKANGTMCIDDGNVCSADICNGSSTECQHPAGNAGAVCRASTGACDVAETCTGDSLSCPADTGAPDSDNDGQCDAVDLCTNGAPVISGKLILANFATGNGDDTLNFSGTLAFTTLPALDPIANGVRVRLEDADEALFDVTVPGGAYNTITKTGWKLNAPGTQWKFSSPIAVGGAITQVTLTKKTPQIKFVVKGKKGAFAALPVTAPVTTTLVLTPPLGLTGACSDVSFSGAQCAFNAGQKTLTCQR